VKRTLARVGEALLTLWLLATLCFVLLRAAPGGPFDGEKVAAPEVQAALAAQYRLDRPLLAQYGAWLGDVVRGDLGPSFQYPDYRVRELIAEALPVSLLNGLAALALALLLGIPLGVLAARAHGRWPDRVLMFGAGLGLAIPKFVAAPLLILLFAVTLHWLPAGGWDGTWRSAVLPVLALAGPNLAYCARLTRASLLEVFGSDWLRAARGRGLSETR
jgi:oligopeptide transport system permease protein